MGASLLAAVGLLLVLEGVLPFFNPAGWRAMFERILKLTDGQLRFIGLGSMLLGLIVLSLAGH